jgi:hypothetical protein
VVRVHRGPPHDSLRDKFVDEGDPERTLPEKERARRAETARLLYHERLRLMRLNALRLKLEAATGP